MYIHVYVCVCIYCAAGAFATSLVSHVYPNQYKSYMKRIKVLSVLLYINVCVAAYLGCCSVVQYGVAVCCSVLQCVAECVAAYLGCCSVVQYGALW